MIGYHPPRIFEGSEPFMLRTVVSLSMMATAILLAGCSNSAPEQGTLVATSAIQATETSQAVATATEVATETATATPVAAATPYPLGGTVELGDGVQLTLHGIEDPVTNPGFWTPADGNRFVAIDVEACTTAAPGSLNPFQYRAQLSDNTRWEANIGVREPALNHTELVAGDCVRGWVSFEVPAAGDIATFNFETNDPSTFRPVVVKWAVR
ncbi:MAG: hypothetical protein AB7S26_43115 [Sandaracinaceae bacterium]